MKLSKLSTYQHSKGCILHMLWIIVWSSEVADVGLIKHLLTNQSTCGALHA